MSQEVLYNIWKEGVLQEKRQALAGKFALTELDRQNVMNHWNYTRSIHRHCIPNTTTKMLLMLIKPSIYPAIMTVLWACH